MLGVNYSNRSPAYQRNRAFYTSGWNDPNTQTGGGAGIPLNIAVLGGVNYGINYDGTLFQTNDAANPAAPFTGPLGSLENGAGFKLNPPNPGTGQRSLGFIDPETYISIPLERYTIFGRGHFDITDNITAFVEANFTHSSAFAQSFAGSASNIWALQVPYDPANDDPDSPTFGANQANFYPVSRPLADRLNARANPASPWTLGRVLTFLDRLTIETDSDIFQIVGGLRGDVGFKDWTWEVYGSHGNTNVIARQPQGAISHANLQQLIRGTTSTGTRSPTINGPWSQGWTSQATFNPNTCTTGIPLFTANGTPPQPRGDNLEGVVVSDDCKSYATLELNNITTLEQNIVEATLQGAVFENWAGEVRFAAGATYRDAAFTYAPDSGNSGEQPTTGVVNQIALPKPTEGAIDVKEVYGELLFPVLADVPLVQSLELELGARYSSYNLSGDIWTFKALGDWEVTDWLRFRGGYQRANRAPNIFELFAPIAGGLGLSSDACLNIANSTPAFGNVPGNPNRINVQTACNELMVRDGGFDYTTLAEDPTAVDQNPSLYPTGLDQTRMSNFRWTLGYNLPFPFSIALQQGNTDLESEKAQTITAGAVLRSPFQSPLLDRLTITVDYYSIDLEGTIDAPSGTEIYTQCFDPQYNPAMAAGAGTLTGAQLLAGNPYCALINRYPYDAAGVRGAVGSGTDRTYQAPFLNKGGTKTSGLDVTLNWTADFADLGLDMIPGAINLYASANFLFNFEEAAFAGAEFVDYAGTLENESYDYKLFGTLTYLDDWGSVGLRSRYLPDIDPSYATPTAFPTSDYIQFDLFGRVQVDETVEVRAGVDNLFDADPPIVGATPTNAARGSTIQVYDTIGRAYYLGARLRF
jgi:outer membrane receptor protein involved in Fe transport